MEKILFSRHLSEADDLEKYGRNAPLVESEENDKRLKEIADRIYDKIMKERKSAVLFVTSPRIRAKQTAELVARDLKERVSQNTRFRFSVNENLRSTEQGTFLLPKDYHAGDSVEFLQAASRIFGQETHASDRSGAVDNIHYRFGDPVKISSDQYKYPELVGHFTELGESYRATLIRIYSTVLDTAKKYKEFLGDTEVVMVSHGQIYHVLRGLTRIASMIKSHQIIFKKGDSVKLVWDVYKKCSDDEKVPGICMPLDFDLLGDNDMMSLLQEELEYLENH